MTVQGIATRNRKGLMGSNHVRRLENFGFLPNDGGAVTQATSKSTGVTLDKRCGEITMNAALLLTNTTVSFTLTNSAIATNDVVVLSISGGGTSGAYMYFVDSVGAGSCVISIRNLTAGSLSEAVVLSFAVIKAVIA